VGGEGILHDQHAGQVHVINASAARVWELCESRPTLAELTASLAAAYDMPVDHVRADVAAIVDDFLAKGLLEGPASPTE
jgi:PqqD family protein of HPr-rel-A system